jgi:hypothetical protein
VGMKSSFSLTRQVDKLRQIFTTGALERQSSFLLISTPLPWYVVAKTSTH